MEIKFLKIELNNFCSFANSKLDLSDMGNTLVTGRNYCKLDNAYSNGSGKSSIFNGICYALTGETSQGVTNGIENIFADPDDCWVELTFMVDNMEFVVRRIKTPRPDLKITINGEDKSGKGIRESAKLLATYIPDLTSELLSSIIILGQGLPHRFSNNKPAGRKEILEKLTKSDFMIQSIKDRLESRLVELKLNLRAKEDELLSTNTQLSIYKKQAEKLEVELAEYDNSSENSITDSITKLEAEVAENWAEYEANCTKSDDLYDFIEKFSSDKAELILNSNKELATKVTEVDTEIKANDTKYTALNTEIQMLERTIKSIESITDICPTCGQKLLNVTKPDATEYKNQLANLKEELKQVKSTAKHLDKKRIYIVENHELTYKSRIDELSDSIYEFNSAMNKANHEIVRIREYIASLKIKITKLENQRDNYTKIVDDSIATQKLIDELNDSISKQQIEINTINSHINIVQQMITLAKREFRGVLLANIIEFINKKVKQYSKEVFGNDMLNFALNENCIDITYCDKIYENLSGGEKQKIDIIIQLALRDILSKQLSIHSNLLILDEIYDNMDTISCNKITNLISTITDIDSIFIISHHAQDLEITYDNNLQVSKNENGISSLNFV